MAEAVKPRHQVFATPDFHVRLTDGRIASIKHGSDAKPVECISPRLPFGDINMLVIQDSKPYTLSTRGLAPAAIDGSIANRAKSTFTFDSLPGFTVCLDYALTDAGLSYRISLENRTSKPLEIQNLSLPFAINNDFAWGVNATERVLRHSMVAGDNSFIYLTPCDGRAPYLLCMPEAGTKAELFDTRADLSGKEENERSTYQLYLHAYAEEQVAREKGCTWRQPVSKRTLNAGETASYGFTFVWADGYGGVRNALYNHGMLDIRLAPGMTMPRERPVRVAIRSQHKDVLLTAEHPDDTIIQHIKTESDTSLYDITFSHLGENKIVLTYAGGRESLLEFFITLPVRELIALRASFIANHQHRDPSKWYNGLLAEWNNETGALLGPDNYDLIKGWRIYEVTCDDPGLSKPAFLASKNTEYPDADEVEALEYYIEHFVWGGLQRTEDEECSYGIYGIPDWHTLRNSDTLGARGQMHIWRIYDYPHIGLMYLRMYQIGKRVPGMLKLHTAEEYLHRAFRTFLALYQYPQEIDDWSAYKTGLYNELAITEVIDALKAEGQPLQAQRLTYHWQRKAKFFVTACDDLFGSEYPFDTTGTESTHALAKWALANAAHDYQEDPRNKPDYTADQALAFYRYQLECNIACRGVLENAYYLLGSDYRNCSAHYSLSYMSQMGGWAILDDAVYRRESPANHLQLGYASMLSAWALMNAGDEKSGYGYWFPGAMHNGAAGGGFENTPYGETWLDQPHHRGSWYYACEIDLGYCGALRGASTVLYDDPILGTIAYCGHLQDSTVLLEDGVQRRFHHIMDEQRVHITVENARMVQVTVAENSTYTVQLEAIGQCAQCRVETLVPCSILINDLPAAPDANGGCAAFPLSSAQTQLTIRLA